MKSESYFKRSKSPDESQSETDFMMLPSYANPRGNVFGGTILKHVDLIANLVASRHATNANTVTASIDRMTFLKPVHVGNALILSARLIYTKRSSMEVEVTVHTEDLDSRKRVLTGTAFVTVVSLNDDGKPTEVPPLNLDTDNDKKRFREGESRMTNRLKDAGRTSTTTN
jgi:acyl-CoA hydrolase